MKQIYLLVFLIICVKFKFITTFGIKDVSDGAKHLLHQLEAGFESQMQSDESKADTVCEQSCAKQVSELRKNVTELYVAFLALHAELAHINQHINHHERALKHIAHWAHKKDSKDKDHHHHEHALKNGTVHQHVHDHKHNRNDTDDGDAHNEQHSDDVHHSQNATDEHHHHSGHDDHHNDNHRHQEDNHEEEHHHEHHDHHQHKNQEEKNEDSHHHNDGEEQHNHEDRHNERHHGEHHHEEHHHHSHDNDEHDSNMNKKLNFTRDIDEQNDDINQQNLDSDVPIFTARKNKTGTNSLTSKILKSINLDPQTVNEKEFQAWFNKVIDNIHKTAHSNHTHNHDSDSEDDHHEHHEHRGHHDHNKQHNQNDGHHNHHDNNNEQHNRHNHNESERHHDHHDEHNDHNDEPDHHHHEHHEHHNHDHVDDNDENRKNIDDMEKSMNDEDEYTFATCLVRPNRHIALLNQQDVAGRINLWQKKENRGSLNVHIKLKGFEVNNHDERPPNRETRETVISPLEIDGDQQHSRHLSKHSHGFHIHEYGNLSRDCQSTGGHYNPLNSDHGGPMDATRHLGDLGNIRCDENGETDSELSFRGLSLTGEYGIIGRSIVIHQLPDDYGRNPKSATSITTGSSGVRIACCVIEQVKQLPKEPDSRSVVQPIAGSLSNSRRKRETLRRLDGSQTRDLNEILQQFAKYENGVQYRSRFEVRTPRKHPKYSRE